MLRARVNQLRLKVRRTTMPFIVLNALMSLVMFHSAQVKVASPKQTPAHLGQLEVRTTYIEGQMIIADSFTGPSKHIERIDI